MKSEENIHILYVEDDESLAFITKDNLEQLGYTVTHALSGKRAFELYKTKSFQIGLIDVMLPDMDGFTLVEKIRKTNQQLPILFLTAKSMQEDKIKGLSLGADDYITKPFSIKELELRIKIFLKRSHVSNDETTDIIELENISYDHSNLSVQINGTSHNLTYKEGQLLYYLFQHKNKIVRRDDILQDVWGDYDYFLGRSLDVFISRLRKIFSGQEDVCIENIHGVGFRFKVN